MSSNFSQVVNDVINVVELNQTLSGVGVSVVNSKKLDLVTKTSAFTVTDLSQDTYFLNSSTATFIVTLPTASSNNTGRVLHFKNAVGTNAITVSPAINQLTGISSADLVAGASGASVTILSDGTNWNVIKKITPA